ncbi:gop-1 [Pristionchus pacificus]|uniref:Gop-1 n=1 Tax=Pristionchus pacificus TaxID=54126 RepID=A0A2A6CIA2_PRIPA|nr:gop-1 [Pristionchus pacificus]|eukprot:PDM77808.1 gop-1 [Pristionchus pacificus]
MLRRLGGYSTLWKPKNPHSLEYLKYLQGVLVKNDKVTEGNKKILVEALRAISEILIWGDQNDSSVFDFFLERQMLTHFLHIMRQDNSGSICVQLLQTLNILFENIRHETSLYFLLSNNHVNEIITHKFDLRNEEIMAYYISFVKTLSLKLNQATIHFFFNEATNDFPLLTESLKLYNFSESMVRIAVRTIFLNIVRVQDENMQKFVHGASREYLKEVVDGIVGVSIDLDQFVRSAENVQANRDRLRTKVDELIDSFHYVGELLILGDCMADLARLLSHRFIFPLLLTSLVPRTSDAAVLLSSVAALFSIGQFIQIVNHKELIHTILTALLFEDATVLVSHWTRADDSFCLQAVPPRGPQPQSSAQNRVFFNALLSALDVSMNDDYAAFFALYTIYAIFENKGDADELLTAARLPHASRRPEADPSTRLESEKDCDPRLLEALRLLVGAAGRANCRLRTITLQLACLVLRQFVMVLDSNDVHDQIRALAESTKKCLTGRLSDAAFVHHKDLFIDMFDEEYVEFESFRLRLDVVGHELLLPPSSSPMSGLQLNKRIPSGREETTRATLASYLHVRRLERDMADACDDELPVRVGDNPLVAVDDCINLANSDLLSCTVIVSPSNERQSRFLVADQLQLILVEPAGKAGWGAVRFAGLLQDTSISGEPTDSRVLHIVVEGPPRPSGVSWRVGAARRTPLLQAKLVFDDHIRCMAGKQRLTKGRQGARELKHSALCAVLRLRPPVDARGHPTDRLQRINPFRVVTGCAPGSVRKQNSPHPAAVEQGDAPPEDPVPKK